MSNLQNLLDRVEECADPDKEVDAEICVAFFGGEIVWKQANYTMEPYAVHKTASTAHLSGFAHEPVRPYTASIDAAISLFHRMLPDRGLLIGRGRTRPDEPLWGAQVFASEFAVKATSPIGEGESEGAAKAIIAATLRALIEVRS